MNDAVYLILTMETTNRFVHIVTSKGSLSHPETKCNIKTNKQVTNNSRYDSDRPLGATPRSLLDNDFHNEIYQSNVSQQYYSQ